MICVSTQCLATKRFKAFRGTVQGSYNFWFCDPENGEHDPNAHFPLLIFLHGKSLCGTNLERVRRYGPIDATSRDIDIDCYVMAPQNPGGSWKPEKIWKIVEWAKENYSVDTTRIYVYGMSLGGYGTIDFAAAYPDKLAAAMAICGGGTAKDLSGLSKIPLWIIHGTADRAVSVKQSDKVVEAIKATGDDSRLRYSRLKGIDHGKPARIFYMQQTYEWLFSHCLKDEGRTVNRDFDFTPEILNNSYRELMKKEYIQVVDNE
ncbi:MAG: dienelactone hydrolase family protein [Bacteroidaceae bacterium]|nr:dienelactone hydrolase family protein [Bacteroidaceae bacterium]